MEPLTVITALQELHAGIEGVRSAPLPPEYPGSLNAADLPCVLVVPSEAEHALQRIGAASTRREYRVFVYCAAVVQGRDGAGFTRTLELIPRFAAAYFANRVLRQGGAEALIAMPFADSGHIASEYAGVLYHAFTFTLNILESS